MDQTTQIEQSVPCPNGTPTSVLDVMVSWGDHYMDNNAPDQVNLLKWLTTDVFKNDITYLRSLPTKGVRDKVKAKLPIITPSGLFKNRIAEDQLIKHSGLLAFDIDLKDNLHIKNYSKLKEQLSNIPNVAYCGLSASGMGYWGLVKIAHPEKHKQHFEALYRAFLSLGITIDKKPSNVASKRGCSYDPDPYFNHNPSIFYSFMESNGNENPNKKQLKSTLLGKTYKEADPADLSKFIRYVRNIEDQEIDITDGYEAWFSIGCSIANEFGDEGRSYFHRISQFHPNYEERQTDKLYTSCLKEKYGYSMGTFYYYCKQEGVLK